MKKILCVLLVFAFQLSILMLSVNAAEADVADSGKESLQADIGADYELAETAVPSESQFASNITSLQNTYVNGKYWNKASSSDYSRTGNIACNGTSYSNAHYGMSCSSVGYCDNCSCECGYFAGCYQCMGFAYKMAYLSLGSYPGQSGWSQSYSLGTVNAGDVIRIRNDNHSIFIYRVDGDIIYYADCNWTGPCQVRWGAKYTYSQLSATFTYKWHLSGNSLTGNNAVKYNLAYYGNGGSGTMSGQTVSSDEWFTIKPNAFTRSGYTFSGYYVKRESDKKWYTASYETGWQPMSSIQSNGYSFYRYVENKSFKLNSEWTKGAINGDTFTFYAQWLPSTPSLEFHDNYSGFNYLLGSDLDADFYEYIFSRNKSVYTVNVDTSHKLNGQNSLKIIGSQAGSNGNDLEFRTSTNTGYAEGSAADNKNMVFSFWGKSSVSGAKMYARWGYSSNYQSVSFTTDWQLYNIPLPKGSYYSLSIHPYFDKAGDFYINSPVVTDGTWTSRFEPETESGIEIRYYTLYGQYYNLPTRVREGYIFDGWYTDKVGGTKITEGSNVFSGDKCAYAHWTKAVSETPSKTIVSDDGHRYEFYDNAMSWKDAESFCESKGGHLATISSAEENDIVLSLIDKNTRYSWIGAKYDEPSRAWSWITGEEFTYNNWAPGEPTSKNGLSSVGEPYAMMHPLNYSYNIAMGSWNDCAGIDNVVSYYCWQNSSFICEYDLSKKVKLTLRSTVPTIEDSEFTFDYGEEIDILPEPYYDNHDFLGWFTQTEGGTKINLPFTITTDTELFAHWQMTNVPSTEPVTPFLLGDADGDNDVTVLDATVIQRQFASIPTFNYIKEAADADEDNEVTIIDATVIQRWLAELPSNDRIGQLIG